jgi:hypothetical protein
MRQPAENWHGCRGPAPTYERCSTDPPRPVWGADAVATANAPAVGNGGHDFVAGLQPSGTAGTTLSRNSETAPSERASWLPDPPGRDDPCSWSCSVVLQIY